MKRSEEDLTSYRWIVGWVCCVLGAVFCAFLLATCLSPSAHARQLTPSECYSVAIDAYTVARWRDGGMAEMKADQIVKSNGQAMMGGADSYLQSSEDLDRLRELVHRIYLSTTEPAQWGVDAYHACMSLGYGKQPMRL